MRVTLEAVRAVATCARASAPPAAGLLAVLFGSDHLRHGVRVAVLPLAEESTVTGPVAQLLQRTSPSALSVHVVRAGGGGGGGGGGDAKAAPPPFSSAHAVSDGRVERASTVPFSSAHAVSDGRVERASTVPACLQAYLESAEAASWHGQGAPPLVLLDGSGAREALGESLLLDALTVCAEFNAPALVVWGELSGR